MGKRARINLVPQADDTFTSVLVFLVILERERERERERDIDHLPPSYSHSLL